MERETYKPCPMDTVGVELPEELNVLVEAMAKNVHEVWAATRIKKLSVCKKCVSLQYK